MWAIGDQAGFSFFCLDGGYFSMFVDLNTPGGGKIDHAGEKRANGWSDVLE